MGVSGLFFFAQENGCGREVDLTALAGERKEAKEIFRLAVDGSALQYYLYDESRLDWLRGGQYEEFSQFAQFFIQRLLDCGVSLRVFFDGCVEGIKKATFVKRCEDNIKKVHELVKQVKEKHTNIQRANFYKPLLAKHALVDVLLSMGVEVIQTEREADPVIARHCRSSDGECDAVLSNDSDFLIFDVKGYIPLNSLRFDHPAAGGFKGTLLTRQRLADSLGIQPKMLPLFACLVGNDFVSKSDLLEFHKRLIYGAPSAKKGGQDQTIIRQVAAFIRDELNGGGSSKKAKKQQAAVVGSEPAPVDQAAVLERAFSACPAAVRARVLLVLQEATTRYDVAVECAEDEERFAGLSAESDRLVGLRKAYRAGLVSMELYGVVAEREFWARIAINETSKTDGFEHWRPFRRRMYAVLCKHLGVASPAGYAVQEYGRSGMQYRQTVVGLDAAFGAPALDWSDPCAVFLAAHHSDTPAIRGLAVPQEQLVACVLRCLLIDSPKLMLEAEFNALLASLSRPIESAPIPSKDAPSTEAALQSFSRNQKAGSSSNHSGAPVVSILHVGTAVQVGLSHSSMLSELLSTNSMLPPIARVFDGCDWEARLDSAEHRRGLCNDPHHLERYEVLRAAVLEGIPPEEAFRPDPAVQKAEAKKAKKRARGAARISTDSVDNVFELLHEADH